LVTNEELEVRQWQIDHTERRKRHVRASSECAVDDVCS